MDVFAEDEESSCDNVFLMKITLPNKRTPHLKSRVCASTNPSKRRNRSSAASNPSAEDDKEDSGWLASINAARTFSPLSNSRTVVVQQIKSLLLRLIYRQYDDTSSADRRGLITRTRWILTQVLLIMREMQVGAYWHLL